ncbi:blumeria specific protein [Blumeria hordei DH14]|uniref:Blumeria specific protein n=1 Tax=Blumeria graminis f. sp. hordei (strain DH14) TaxID=546991 RepID=N1JLT9_BLUG1|nr:blumeria specific protein [Blumeria hordei DH14]
MHIGIYFTLAFHQMIMYQMQVKGFSDLLPTHMYLALYFWLIYLYVYRFTSTGIITYDPWRLINTGQKPQLIRNAHTQSHSYQLSLLRTIHLNTLISSQFFLLQLHTRLTVSV